MSEPSDQSASLAWAAAGALVCAAMAPLEPNLLEEGFALHVAQRIAGGEHLYRDIVFFSGPFPFEALALLFRAFGEEIAVARGAVVVLHALATGFVFDLARRAGAGPLAHVAGAALAVAPVLLFPFLSIYFHTTIAFYLTGVAVYAGLRATGSWRWGLLAGAAVACVGMTKQSLGAVLAVSLVPAVALGSARGERLARGATVSLGVAVTGLAIVAVFVARGDLGALYHGIIELPLTLGSTFESGYINLWPPGELVGNARYNAPFYLPKLAQTLPEFRFVPGFLTVLSAQIAFLLPWLALVATAAARATGPLHPALWLNAAGLLALTANLFPRADWGHLVFSLPPATVQLVLLIAARARLARPDRATRWVVAALVVVSAAAGVRLWTLSRAPNLGPRVPLRPISELASSIAPAVDYLLERVDEGTPIFVARAEPLIYFATKTRNPTPFEGIVPGFREEQENEIIRGLEEVRYVVMSDVDQPFMSFYADELPAVQAYLERHFRLAEGFRGDLKPALVFERGDDRGETLVDLLKDWLHAGLWVRGSDGARYPWTDFPPRLATRHNRRPIPTLMGAGGGGIDFRLLIPKDAVFQADLGLRGLTTTEGLLLQNRLVHMSVSVARDDEEFVQLGSILQGTGPGRQWTPFEVDLGDYGGEYVTLRLEATPTLSIGDEGIVWWGSPRITRRVDAP